MVTACKQYCLAAGATQGNIAYTQTVVRQCKKTADPQMAHLVFAETQADPSQNQKSRFFPHAQKDSELNTQLTLKVKVL